MKQTMEIWALLVMNRSRNDEGVDWLKDIEDRYLKIKQSKG